MLIITPDPYLMLILLLLASSPGLCLVIIRFTEFALDVAIDAISLGCAYLYDGIETAADWAWNQLPAWSSISPF